MTDTLNLPNDPSAWLLCRKRDGFIRGAYSEKPSRNSYEIAAIDGDEYVECFTADQVRAAVLAERERCATVAAEWKPIETAPESTPILTYAPWDVAHPIAVCSYTWVSRTREDVESESTNANGRRIVIQEVTYREREWEGAHWEPTHWMLLPPPPKESE